MKTLKKITNFEASLSYTQYRFDKISNFLSFEQYKEEKVKEFIERLVKQPKFFEIEEREDKRLTVEELKELKEQSIYTSIKMKLSNGKHYGGDCFGMLGIIEENKELEIIELKATW